MGCFDVLELHFGSTDFFCDMLRLIGNRRFFGLGMMIGL